MAATVSFPKRIFLWTTLNVKEKFEMLIWEEIFNHVFNYFVSVNIDQDGSTTAEHTKKIINEPSKFFLVLI